MAEAICGPSNPLQSFQKHTAVDRTLQQDRTFLRQSPTQSFRSSSPLAGSLDAEFEAFQTPQSLKARHTVLHPPQSFSKDQLPARSQHITPFPQSAVQPLPNWASDFQRLNISRPEAATPRLQVGNIGNSHTRHDGWHKEFMAQSGSLPQEMYQQSAQSLGLGWQPQFQNQPYIGDAMNYIPPLTQQPQIDHVNGESLNFDEASFEEAFSAARQAIDETDSKNKEKERVNDATQPRFNMGFACTDPGDVMGEYDFDQHAPKLGLKAQDPDLAGLTREDLGVHDDVSQEELPKIGSDTIPADSGLSPAAESDELSRTAGVLLDTLKDERNSKFQNSAFLGLMRQLRDKEIRIEGDQMVSTTESSHPESFHPGGRYYPYDAFDEHQWHQKQSDP